MKGMTDGDVRTLRDPTGRDGAEKDDHHMSSMT